MQPGVQHQALQQMAGMGSKGAATVQPQQPPPMAAAGWPLRVRTALQLAACADLLAARFSMPSRPTPIQVDVAMNSPARQPDLSGALRQAMAVAWHLSEHDGTIEQDVLARELASQWAGTRGSGSISGTRRVLAGVIAGDSWRTNATALRGGQGSYGSDAAVRAIATGMLPQPLSAIAAAARTAASITHGHPLAGDGAAALAICVALAARARPAGIPAGRFLAAAAAAAVKPQFPSLLPMVRTLIQHRAGPAEAAATLHTGTTTLRTVPAALTAFLRHPGDPAGAIRYALLMAGPNRAIAAMTAALAGVNCPHFTIPDPWLPPAAARQHIRAIASALAGLATQPAAAQSHPPFQPIAASHTVDGRGSSERDRQIAAAFGGIA